ncbi:MAG TPA: lasso peptide biosynthesis B2 protein [Longimicrobiaceae bacterium]|jgi:hypothetical protein|nr:lasso peptide biosynthesis B2 protein [Longimicrobiaceae bacterium]
MIPRLRVPLPLRVSRRVADVRARIARRRDGIGLLLRAAWLLPVRTLDLRLRGLRGAPDGHRVRRGTRPAASGAPVGLARAKRLERAVALAARYGVCRGTCLSRSLVLLDLMEREGLAGDLRIGVRVPGSVLEAHAWVQLGSVVLNDRDDVERRYAPLRGQA